MPQLMEIAGMGIPAGDAKRLKKQRKAPIRSLREVKIAEVGPAHIIRATRNIMTADMKSATRGIRLAMVALVNHRFEEAGNIAINSAIEASAAFNQNPKMGTRIFATARWVIKNAVLGKLTRDR